MAKEINSSPSCIRKWHPFLPHISITGLPAYKWKMGHTKGLNICVSFAFMRSQNFPTCYVQENMHSSMMIRVRRSNDWAEGSNPKKDHCHHNSRQTINRNYSQISHPSTDTPLAPKKELNAIKISKSIFQL